MNFEDFVYRTNKWQRSTFSNKQGSLGVIKHIRRELKEIEEDPSDLFEWLDIIFLALDGARREGYSPKEVCDGLEEKLKVNESRRWPSPEEQKDGEPIEHLKDNDECYEKYINE